MQQAFGVKQFVAEHVVVAALTVGLVVSSALGFAGMAVNGNLPWRQDAAARVETVPATRIDVTRQRPVYDAQQLRINQSSATRLETNGGGQRPTYRGPSAAQDLVTNTPRR